MATGDDGDAERHDPALAPTTPGQPDETMPAGGTATSPGRVIAPPTAAGDESMLREGDAVDRYRIDGYLGRGGMGVVYRARDPDLDRMLAIKLVRSRRRGGDRMLREAQAMARLDHPNVVPIFDVGMRGEQVFLVMPFLPGGTLGDWCRAAARPWREVVARYVEAGRGLEAAHRAGLVHRDFKPDNVLIDACGEVHVADFGLARVQEEASGASAGDRADGDGGLLGYALTQAGELLGTPAYMAPEQLDGRPVDDKADQFSFCVALHEGLYGTRPFALARGASLADQREALRAERVRPPPPGRDVPPWIRDAILRGLRHDPAARWPSLTALLAELERGLRRRRRPPPRLVAAGLAAAVTLAGAVGVAAWWTSRPARAPTRVEPSLGREEAPLAARQLTFRGDLGEGRLAPDDHAVAALAGDDLVVVPLAPGGAPRTLARDPAHVSSIAWSPDSTHVLLVSRVDDERSAVDLFDAASGEREHHELPVWPIAVMTGPREIASAMTTSRDLRLTSIDGAEGTRRCPIPGEYLWIMSLHAAGGAVFVTVGHHDDRISVYRTDRHCTQPHVVIDHVASGPVIVDHDGTHVGVVRTVDGARVLERTAIAGGAVTRSAALPDDVAAIAGRTSRGALVATRGSVTWQLVRLAGEPARVADVIATGSAGVLLDVSPDGARVARVDQRDGARAALRVVPIDDLDARPAPIAGDLYDVAWSPDGRRLAGLVEADGHANLVVVAADGGPLELTPLAPRPTGHLVWVDDRRVAFLRHDNQTFVAVDVVTHATEELLDPSLGWSFHLAVNRADGALALFWNRAGGQAVYIVRPGHEAERVTTPGLAMIFPEWSPDGRTLWLFDPRGGTIDRHDVASGERRRVFATDDRATYIVGLWPQPGDRLIAHLARPSRDLVVLE